MNLFHKRKTRLCRNNAEKRLKVRHEYKWVEKALENEFGKGNVYIYNWVGEGNLIAHVDFWGYFDEFSLHSDNWSLNEQSNKQAILYKWAKDFKKRTLERLENA